MCVSARVGRMQSRRRQNTQARTPCTTPVYVSIKENTVTDTAFDLSAFENILLCFSAFLDLRLGNDKRKGEATERGEELGKVRT